ncbi:carbohydrate ABC transporter permease [Cohnella suwonensis]|uniref:Carbohydrate ABC transporter permease n=1 Tax=Cohnella suwonensis TaxID=696072 RepID=A0ABW0LXY1_9BACL
MPSLLIIAVRGAGSVIVIFMAGMQDVPQYLLEAVEIDGGGWWRRLRSVTIPLMSPVIFYNIVLAFINSLTASRRRTCSAATEADPIRTRSRSSAYGVGAGGHVRSAPAALR